MELNTTSVAVKTVPEILEEQEAKLLEEEQERGEEALTYQHSLAGYIIGEYHVNQSAKQSSGIENEILESVRSFNGEYSAEDLSRIAESGGSRIFMNITATKCRAAKSWIADILKPAKGKAWTIEPTPSPELPQDISKKIEAALKKEFVNQQIQQNVPQGAEGAQETIRDFNQRQRDIKKAIKDEIYKEASFQMETMECQIEDQLKEGGWGKALLDFIDDFVVYPSAFLKGPVITKEPKLVWRNGKPVVEKVLKFTNERVDSLDIYPSPRATSIQDGNLIEHLRLERKDVAALRELEKAGYKRSAIDRVLSCSGETGGVNWWFSTSIEADKAQQEDKGNEFEANRGIYHGMHFWGSIQAKLLKEWEFDVDGFDPESDDNDMVEVEAILMANEVIKCVVNDDPLLRRPYYKASFMNKPGSFWGRSLPNLMRDIQRMCNATARALANNLGIASGPQVQVNIDRLASNDDELEALRPLQIWQTKSDPSGGQGKAIDWFQPTSNANELLAVYKAFEERADDVTGIPRYAYGNERMTGAAATLGGLSMLLESASKIIKDAIRSIDEGLVKPRVEYQFYMNMIMNPNEYTGDVTVTPIGSAILSIKAFEAMRRNEFLAATANKFDQETMGPEGRANVLRKVGEDIGVPNPVPTEFELKQKQKKAAQAAQAAAQREADEKERDRQASLAATTTQVEGQKEMAQTAQQVKLKDIQRREMKDHADVQLEVMKNSTIENNLNKEIALKIASPDNKGI